MKPKKCLLCSKLYSIFNNFFFFTFGFTTNCKIALRVLSKTDNKVNGFRLRSKNCSCESHKLSKFSPNPTLDSELVSRFIFDPIHVNKKNGKIKSSLFSHISNRGCSVQRETIANDEEISSFISSFLQEDSNRIWHGLVKAEVNLIRQLIDSKRLRRLCVYDTANRNNPAHAELFQAQTLEPDDEIELRNDLMNLFRASTENPQIIAPSNYRDNLTYKLPNQLKNQIRI